MDKANAVEIVEKSSKELQKCKDNQIKLWDEKGYPHFASVTGRCFKCHKDVYQNYVLGTHWEPRISYGHDGKTLVTGCPHCHKSFCD